MKDSDQNSGKLFEINCSQTLSAIISIIFIFELFYKSISFPECDISSNITFSTYLLSFAVLQPYQLHKTVQEPLRQRTENSTNFLYNTFGKDLDIHHLPKFFCSYYLSQTTFNVKSLF